MREKKEIESEELIAEKTPDEKEIFWAFTAYIFFLIPLLSPYKSNFFVKYHIKQSISLCVAAVLIFLVFWLFGLDRFIWKALIYVLLFIFWCFGAAFALLGMK